jgi:hypothetical protein
MSNGTFVGAYASRQSEQFRNSRWLLLYGNSPAHRTSNVRQFRASRSICVIQRPPITHVWHRQTFSLFPKVKLALKGERFSDISDIQRGTTELPKGVSLQHFQRAFEDL